jgi:phosphoglycerol transferase
MLYWRILASHGLQSAYWITPLACLALLQMARGMPITRSRETFVFIATAVVLGLESHYEVVFAGSLAFVAVIVACVQQRSLQTLKTFGVFVAAMVAGFIVNVAPTIDWVLTHHGQIYKYTRAPIEAYLYSLSIGQMILPNLDHRIAAFAHIRREFDAVFPALDTENRSATLGFIGDFGLLALIAAVVARGSWKITRTLEHSSFLTIAALGIATTGGLAAIFNIFVSADVHSFTRISTWIAFFCLIAIAYVLERLWRYSQTRNAVALYVAFCIVLTVAGVLDQSPAHTAPYAESRKQAELDRAWALQIESVEPPGAAILELPYTDDVDSLEARLEQVPFMYSTGLRWSVGAYRETPEAGFESWLTTLPANRMVAAGLLSGFEGILVYRSSYNDQGRAIEKDLRAATGIDPLVSGDGTQSLFPIHRLVAKAHSVVPSVGVQQGINEAIAVYRNSPSGNSDALVRIENAIKPARAKPTSAEGPSR